MAVFKSSKDNNFNPQELNIINSGTSVAGDIQSEGDLRIDGSIQGNVTVKSKLVIGPSGKIKGDIKAQNCDVSGDVNGNLQIGELLTVKATAKIRGDVSSSKLIIEAGAEFNGKSTMNAGKGSGNGQQKPVQPIDVKPAVKPE